MTLKELFKIDDTTKYLDLQITFSVEKDGKTLENVPKVRFLFEDKW